jgi:hypothetical protein
LWEANQFRLFLHMGAYWLLHALRRAAPKRSRWRGATFETIRRTFVKIAVRVEELKGRVTSPPAMFVVSFAYPSVAPVRRSASTARHSARRRRAATGWVVNNKRVERIWRREGLKVPKKQPKRGRLWLTDDRASACGRSIATTYGPTTSSSIARMMGGSIASSNVLDELSCRSRASNTITRAWRSGRRAS